MTVFSFIIHRRYAFISPSLSIWVDPGIKKRPRKNKKQKKKDSILRMIGDLLVFFFFLKEGVLLRPSETPILRRGNETPGI